MRSVIVAAAVCCPLASSAQAQTSPYLGVIAATSIELEGSADGHYLSDALGGLAPAVVLFTGLSIKPTLVVNAEFTIMGAVATNQRRLVGSGTETSTTAHRDVVASGLLGYQKLTDRVIGQIVGGFSFSHGNTTRRDLVFTSLSGVSPPLRLPDDTVTQYSVGLSAGVNIEWRILSRASIASMIRMHYLPKRDTEIDGMPRFGIGSAIYLFGVGVRLDL